MHPILTISLFANLLFSPPNDSLVNADTTLVVATNEAYKLHWSRTTVYAGWKESEKKNVNKEVIVFDSLLTFQMPVSGKKTSEYSRLHTGWDLSLKMGENVYAAMEGRVRFAGETTGGYGNMVVVRHPNGVETWYAHLSEVKVTPGQKVRRGQVVGLGGSTGRSTGPHLHWEMRYKDVPLDLAKIIDYKTKKIIKSQIKVKELTGDGMLHLTHHKICEGETIESIAQKHGSTADRLARLNGIEITKVLEPGKYIRVK
ncbi:MAG: peptidoglycan DD-metalloendopeptidase family protein [Bacteroidota bacterium]|jgi:LysM repeat protein